MTVTERTLYPDPLSDLHWAAWLSCIIPDYCTHRFGPHHRDFWEWVWSIELGRRVPPEVDIWARGGAKSTSAEGAVAAVGARDKRRYAMYVCDVQDRADDHVGNVGAMFEGERMEAFYPQHADRDVGKFGNSKGWRRNRLRTRGGFIVDAIGLDVAARGIKIEDQRPDLIVFDDLDGQHDTTRTTAKKIDTITNALIPAGSSDVAVLAIQNLIHPNGIFARMVDGRADFLADRRVSGPVPALENMTVAPDGTVDGVPTWEGQDLETCRSMISLMGMRAFRRECQHDVTEVEGALFRMQPIDDHRVTPEHYAAEAVGRLDRLVVSIDPNTSSSEGADEAGIVVVCRTADRQCPTCGEVDRPHFYVPEDISGVMGPDVWAKRGVAAYHRHDAHRVVAEKNQGGEMVKTQLRQFDRDIPVTLVHAAQGKTTRAEVVATAYEEGRVHHVGVLDHLETQLTTWVHGVPESPGAYDALVHGIRDLMVKPVTAGKAFVPSGPIVAPQRGARW